MRTFMTHIRCWLRAAASTVALVCAGGMSAPAAEITLKAAMFVPPSTIYGGQFKGFVDHLNEAGKGEIQIRIVGGPEAVPADGQAQAVKTGVLDIAVLPPAYYKSVMVEGDAQILSDMSVAEQRKSGAYDRLNAIAGERINAVYLTTFGIGVPFHFYVTKEMTVSKPEDLRGLRFRGQPNYNAIFKHYSIAGVNIAPPEVYTALERGTVQGYGYPLWGIDDFGWEKLTKTRIDPGFYNVTINVLMNKDKYSALTPAQRKALDDSIAWFEREVPRFTAGKTKETLEMQAKAGIKVVNFGPEWAKTAVELYWEDLKKLSPAAMTSLQPLLMK